MSRLFVDSLDAVRAPGAYAIEVAPPVVIEGQVIGYLGFVFQGEWGPANEVTEPGAAEFLTTYFPPGTPHTSTGYLALKGRKRIPIRPVRILNGGVAANLTAAAGTGTYTATAKYKGTAGNAITLTWSTASDGVAAHRNLVVAMTDSVTGTTTETYRNVTFAQSLDCTLSNLLASLTWAAPDAVPGAGSVALASGTNGAAITLTEYTAALLLLASRTDIFVVCTDDCGNALRNDVNDAVVAHIAATKNRLGVIQSDNPSETWANVKTTVGSHSPTLRSDRVLPQGAWVQIKDDAGALQTTPFSTFVASCLCNLEPQQSHAWWDDKVTEYYEAIAGIVAPFSTADEDVQGDATELGIGLPIRLDNGAYASLHDRTSSLTSGKRFTVTRRIKDFLAKALTSGTRSFVNGANWRGRQIDVKSVVDEFLGRQDAQSRPDDPRLVAWSTSIALNTPTTTGLGQFKLSIDATSVSVMEKIGFMLNVGESVTVRETT